MVRKINHKSILTVVLSILIVNQIVAQPMERKDIKKKDTWDLTVIYPSVEEWKSAKISVEEKVEKLPSYKGTLTKSGKQLLSYLEFSSELSKEMSRLYSYASMHSDEDTKVTKYLALKQEMSQLFTKAGSLASFDEPEILTMDKKKLDAFFKEEPGLAVYKVYLNDLFRKKEHRLSEKEEKILAEAGLVTSTPYSIFNIFANAEMPYPEVTLSDGTKARLDQSGYSRYRASANRADRELVFNEFWTAMESFQRTFAEQLYGGIKSDVFYSRVRGYNSALEKALDGFNIPTDVYHSLVNNVNDNLSYFHRYLELRKRLLGVDTLKYSDMYAEVVDGVNLKYSIEEAQKMVVEAMAPLGEDYQKVLQQAYDDRWVDVYPTPGKRSGAYANGSIYDVHPYVLLNYNEQYNDVSTLAHEMGHAMHSYLSNKNQPYPTSDYSIFVAEVASTFNEVLLIDKVLNDIKNEDIRLSLLMNYLDGFKGTLFRQTQFAEFELRIHDKVENGEPLTSDVLNELYGEILKKYYGHDKGVCHIDDLYTVEWAYIPHFYYNYYVYQYATSYTASIALAEKVMSEKDAAVKDYLAFLSSGSSDYPIELLKKAGVDMTSDEPFKKAMQSMDRIMDEIDEILKKKGL